MHEGSEACFTLHDDVGDAHLAAQGGEENDELDGVDVVCDDDERGFFGFDEGDDVVEAEFDEEGLLGALLTTTVSKRLSERDDERGKGMDGPLHPSPSPQQQIQQQQSNGPSSPASTGGGTCTTG